MVLYVQVARLVHVTYWVPAGRAMDATAGTLRVGAVDATAGGPSFLLKTQQASPLHPPHGGGREGAGRRRCRMAPEVQAGTVFPPCDGVL